MITQILCFLNKSIHPRLVTSCILTLSLAITQAALAGYQAPPEQTPPSGYTGTTAPRGECASTTPPLTLLAPLSHVGQTTSLHPTFAWFVPHSGALPVEFSLYEFDQKGTLKLSEKSEKIELKTSPGIMKVSLPKDKPGLTVGKRYLWQVEIICNRNRPSQNKVSRTEIQVVQIPGILKSALSSTSDRTKKAQLYAEAGFWYDAFSEALGAAKDGQLGEAAASLLQDLAQLEKPQQSVELTQIANKEQ